MAMTELQRSTTSFRRQGSSGLVWDDKFLSGELNQKKEHHQEGKIKYVGGGSDAVMRRSRSDGGERMFRTPVKMDQLGGRAADPPSPKVQACGFCSVFGKSTPANKGKKHNRPRK